LACASSSAATAAAAAAAAAVVSLVVIALYMLCRVFQPTKNAFVDTLRSVVADVKWFLLFLVLTMWGFAGAFYILFREDQQQFQVTSSHAHAALFISSSIGLAYQSSSEKTSSSARLPPLMHMLNC